MNILRPFTFVLLALFAFANHAFSAPVITNVAPPFGKPGATVVISGSGLSGATVHFDGASATPSSNTDTEISVNVPQLTPGNVPLTVTTGSGTSNSTTFTVQGLWTAFVTDPQQLRAGFISAITIPTSGFATTSTKVEDITPPVILNPIGIAITPDGKTALATDGIGHSVSIIDIASNKATGAIPLARQPFLIAINSLGTVAYVTNFLDGTVTPIDLTTNPPTPHTPFLSDLGSPTPTGIAISFDNKNLYVVNSVTNHLTPFDISTNPLAPVMGTSAPLPTSAGSQFLTIALTPASAPIQKAFIPVLDSSGATSTVLSLSLANPQAPSPAVPILLNGRSRPLGAAVSPDGAFLFVADSDPTTGFAVSIIDTQNDSLLGEIVFTVGDELQIVAITPDGKQLLVDDLTNDGVFPVDLTTVLPSIQAIIPTGNTPALIAITPDQAPHASFTANAVPAGSSTLFDASNSASPVGSIANYLWDFGDGTDPIGTASPQITHTYAAPGTYSACLTVTNTAGTSTQQVFPTGQTISNNGNSDAFTCNTVTVLPVISNLVCPPVDVEGKQQKTRYRRLNVITWKAPSKRCGEETPVAYRIYSDEALTTLVGTVTAHPGQEKFRFKVAAPHRKKQTYFVVSVDQLDHQSLPVSVTIRHKERDHCHSK